SDNDDFPNLDLVAEDRLDDILLRIEDPSGPDEARLFDSRSFRNAAIGREIALENLEMPRRVHWIRPWTNHALAAWGLHSHSRYLLRHRAASNGHALAVQNAMVEQHSQHL